jgi:hypothetical protein
LVTHRPQVCTCKACHALQGDAAADGEFMTIAAAAASSGAAAATFAPIAAGGARRRRQLMAATNDEVGGGCPWFAAQCCSDAAGLQP